jgi:trehalose 6-phosphate synthase
MNKLSESARQLQDLLVDRLAGLKLIVVSNREPYIHRFRGPEVECVRPASGVTAALDPVLRACGGVWVAHGSGDADQAFADSHSRVAVPPEDPSYTLRRVWLSKRQENDYYYGAANQALWPLCHVVFTRPVFDDAQWQTYREVNELFADAVLEEAGGEPALVFVQDYHLALLPGILKRRASNLAIAQFWHIPWPNAETFRVCPWVKEILDGLLANDLLGFHLQYHCQNFIETVDRTLEMRLDRELSDIIHGGKRTAVRPFPISIDFAAHELTAESAETVRAMARWRRQLHIDNAIFGIGIDRLDYTKGLPERFRAIDRLLELQPELAGRLVFLQIGVPTRTNLPEYQRAEEEVERLAKSINWRWGSGAWRPIIFLKEHMNQVEMAALHRLAHFCLVTSLHDGMNLVAKEFVASRTDGDGVLILSRFTGAARELTEALLVNPYSADECARAIQRAITMPEDDRRQRMRWLRTVVADNDIYRWVSAITSTLVGLRAARDLRPLPAEAQ